MAAGEARRARARLAVWHEKGMRAAHKRSGYCMSRACWARFTDKHNLHIRVASRQEAIAPAEVARWGSRLRSGDADQTRRCTAAARVLCAGTRPSHPNTPATHPLPFFVIRTPSTPSQMSQARALPVVRHVRGGGRWGDEARDTGAWAKKLHRHALPQWQRPNGSVPNRPSADFARQGAGSREAAAGGGQVGIPAQQRLACTVSIG